MEMEYIVLATDRELYEGILPDYLCSMLAEQRLVLFGGINEAEEEQENEDGQENENVRERLVSIAAFSVTPFHTDEVDLEYIFVAAGYRRQGLAGELLQYCYGELKKSGVRCINRKLCSENGMVRQLLRTEKFIPMTFNGHYLEYALEDLVENKILQKLSDESEEFQIGAYSAEDVRIKRFIAGAAVDKCYMDRKQYSEKYSRFLEENGKITAGILMEQLNENTLFLSRTYKSPECTQKSAFAYLLAECIKAAAEEMSMDFSVCKMQIFTEEEYQFLEKLNVMSLADYRIQECVKIL